jgi:superfamily II DNA or RNA helicase
MITQITYGLRDYQETLVKGIFEGWTHHQRVMAQLHTGGGKTIVFSAIASEFIKRGENVKNS